MPDRVIRFLVAEIPTVAVLSGGPHQALNLGLGDILAGFQFRVRPAAGA